MKLVILVISLFVSINENNVEKQIINKENLTISERVKLDGEIHNQNLIMSIDAFLKELEIVSDTNSVLISNE